MHNLRKFRKFQMNPWEKAMRQEKKLNKKYPLFKKVQNKRTSRIDPNDYSSA